MRFKTTFSKLVLAGFAFAMIPAVAQAGELQTPLVAENCNFEEPEQRNYDMQFVSVRRALKVDVGEQFEVKAYFQNTGNVPLFSSASTC